MNDKVVIYPKTVAQIELEERMGKSIEEIRKEVVAMPNDERFRWIMENGGGGVVGLAPCQYPKRPKDWKDPGEQYTIFDFLR